MSEILALTSLARAFFHEDWVDLYGDDPMAVVDEFARQQKATAPHLPGEVEALLSRDPSEEALRLTFATLDFSYDPIEDGFTYREWLVAVAARVAKVLTEDAGREAGSAGGAEA